MHVRRGGGSIILQFQTLHSRRCQRGFHRVNLHRPTAENLLPNSSTPRLSGMTSTST